MKVARQFIAWDPCENRTRPVGHGMIGSIKRSYSLGGKIPRQLASQRPYGTRGLFRHIPGNKLPGYHHSIPPGQKKSGSGTSKRPDPLVVGKNAAYLSRTSGLPVPSSGPLS